MNDRTIVLSERMHGVLLDALSEYQGLIDKIAAHGFYEDVRRLRNICKAAKISNPAEAAGEVALSVPPEAPVGRPASAGEGTSAEFDRAARRALLNELIEELCEKVGPFDAIADNLATYNSAGLLTEFAAELRKREEALR